MNHITIKSISASRAEILMDGKLLYASALKLRMAVGELPTVFIKLACTVDFEGNLQVCTTPKVNGCPVCNGHGVLEYVFHGSGRSEVHKCTLCAGSGQEPKGERKLVE